MRPVRKKKKTEQSHRVLIFFLETGMKKIFFRQTFSQNSPPAKMLLKHLALIDIWIHAELKRTRQAEGFLLLKAGHGAIPTGKYISLV